MWQSFICMHEEQNHYSITQLRKGISTYSLHRSNLNLVRRQEEDDAEDPAVHFGHRDGEDHHPGQETGQGVD